ncbi:MAG: hypothetical protein HYY16_16640 [Planctomycetes bacterium]|nr:hypothetical protein [Planctomycetota bacterium]
MQHAFRALKGVFPCVLLAAAACDNGGDDGFAPPPPGAGPVAVAGDDLEVVVSASGIALDGSKSRDPSGGAVSFSWSQIAGTPVTLSDAAAASPTFAAPATPETLTFRLTATGPSGVDSDTVDVYVKSIVVTAPDTWFVGYGMSGTLMATVSGGTPPFTFEWKGLEDWLVASGTSTATLNFQAPRLADFQDFSDRAEAAMLKKTTQGRLQLTVRVTDATGASDEDLVNFSVGPFPVTVADENVALGEPMFLNGGAGTSWAWTGTKPNGAAIQFFRPDKSPLAGSTGERFVFFVTDLVGTYQVILTQSPAGVQVLTITSGRYVGVGNQIGITPDPFKGECASCHAGQLPFLAPFASAWLQTGHASMFIRILDPTHPLFAPSQAKGHWRDAFDFGSSYSIHNRTVGWSAITQGTNNGWVQNAAAEGTVFQGTSWDEMKRKFPKTAGLSNVQCEDCHGPGSEHRADTTGIRKSFDASLCGRCHSRKQDLWEASPHGLPPIVSPSGSAACNNCHTAQGFIVDVRPQQAADPHVALFAAASLNRPVIPPQERRGTTCQVCHESHAVTAKRPPAHGHEPQLRAFGNVKFRNDAVVDAGESAICFMCHHSRTDARRDSTDMNVRRAPHESTAAEMLTGTNGRQFPGWSYDVSPHGIPGRFVSPAFGENRRCLTCHMDMEPAAGTPGRGALGDHTFRVTQGTGSVIADQGTHLGAVTVAGAQKFRVASGPNFLGRVFPGDRLTIQAGADVGTTLVRSVDHGRQLTVDGGTIFSGGAVDAWTVMSVVKHNATVCTQCHTTAPDFRVLARGDYDGDGVVEVVQDEVGGLAAALTSAINSRLATLARPGVHVVGEGGRVKYTDGAVTRTFPGPGVAASENPDIVWRDLGPEAQADWLALYEAGYNLLFVERDRSHGIHNTGYAVNLLQSSIFAITGSKIGASFIPFP